MLIVLVVKIVKRARGVADDPFGAGELRHDQAASAKAADDAAKDRIRHAGHGREHGCGANHHVANRKCGREHGWSKLSLSTQTLLTPSISNSISYFSLTFEEPPDSNSPG